VRRRLSICYAAPGHDLLASAGPTRNVLSLARALAAHADVTVAFRRVLDAPAGEPFRALELEPKAPARAGRADDAAVRGASAGEFLRYLAALRRFVDGRGGGFDVVLEKSWLLSGYLARRCGRRGLPAAVVENVVRVEGGTGGLARGLRARVARAASGRLLRRAPLVIAETEELKRALVRHLGLAPERIEVIGLGVDADLFRPRDRSAARRALGLDPAAPLMLYAGVLDRTHDLAPVLAALRAAPRLALELHVVGDGELRARYEALAAGDARVAFHGRVEHAAVPHWIAAADLCLAPYDPAAFPDGEVAYSTLKIPEYQACARAVASVASGRVRALIRPGATGFLLANDPASWGALLFDLPPRERLDAMGREARNTAPACCWADTALAYWSACERLAGVRAAGAPAEPRPR